MQNWQYRPIANRVQELVDVPGSCQRTGLRFAIAYHRSDNQVWVVKRCPAGMGKHISQLASFVNGTGGFRRAVAADAARKRKLLEEFVQTYFILTLFRINLRVRALEIARPQNPWRAVPRTSHKNHVEIEFFDQPIQVDVNKC